VMLCPWWSSAIDGTLKGGTISIEFDS
jgi:hypothetical protein